MAWGPVQMERPGGGLVWSLWCHGIDSGATVSQAGGKQEAVKVPLRQCQFCYPPGRLFFPY